MKTIYLVTFLSLVVLFSKASEKFSNNFSGFLENIGQVTDQFKNVRNDILYSYDGEGFKFFIKRDGVIYEFNQIETDSVHSGKSKVSYHRVEVDFVGANSNPEIVASGKSKDYLNFYLTYLPTFPVLNVHFFDTIRLKNVFPNVDVRYIIKDGSIKYDFIVAPGGKAESIKLHYKGLNKMTLENDGSILIETSLGQIKEDKPFSFLPSNKGNEEVLSSYVIKNDTLAFAIENYDQNKTLIIDPTVAWATYYGGNGGSTRGWDEAVDVFGDVIITGESFSTTGIATSATFQSTYSGYGDGYVAKFAPDGTRIWGTYYGGTAQVEFMSITTDENANVYSAGWTVSNGLGTSGTYQPSFSGGSNSDFLIVKFDKNGLRKWATYYGDNPGSESYPNIAITSNGIAIVGQTGSTTNITTTGSYQPNIGTANSLVSRFDSTGNILWGTYYGGNAELLDVETDSSDNIYFTGQIIVSGYYNFLVQKFSSSGFPIWNNNQFRGLGWGIHVNKVSGNVYCGGEGIESNSNWNYAYLGCFNTTDGSLIWDTVYGGITPNSHYISGVYSDEEENIYVCGRTEVQNNFITADAHQSNFGGGLRDGFFIQFNKNSQILYSTYYGGEDNEEINAVTGDDCGNIYLIGSTWSYTGISTSGGHQTTKSGPPLDAFLIKFGDFITEPTSSAINVNTVISDCLEFDISWSAGNGGNSIVVVKESSPVNSFPVDGNNYIPNSIFGTGDELGNGNFVVYSGTGNGFTLSNLTPGTTYYLAIFDFNGEGCGSNFLTSNFATYSIVVPPALNLTLNPTNESCENVNDGAIQLGVTGGTTPYGFIWNSGNTNEDLSNIGSGLYSVTVSDANSCTATEEITLSSNPLPAVEAGANDTICEGDNAVLTGSGSGNLQWSDGSSASSITVIPTVSTNYFLTVTDSNNCSASDSVLVYVYQSAQAAISGLDSAYCENDSALVLNGTPPGGIFSGQGVIGNVFIPSSANIGENIISYNFSDDCITDASVVVLVRQEPCDEPPTTEFNIYDVYTPNGDGTNDFWVIDGIEAYPNNEITIYNRWGNVVYEAKNYANNWDGKSKKGEYLPSATYYYIIKLGDTANRVFSGDVTLIR